VTVTHNKVTFLQTEVTMTNANAIKPVEQSEFRNALLLILGALPEGADIHFYWADGVQHVTVTLENTEPLTYLVTRNKDGSGVVSTKPN
jgi:hypothetical protein